MTPAFSALDTAVRETMKDRLDEAAEDLLAEIKSEMSKSKSGKKWPRLPNRSSARGEAPAIQSGALEKTTIIKKIDGNTRHIGYIGDDAEANDYGTILELYWSRPALRLAVRQKAAEMSAILGKKGLHSFPVRKRSLI